MDVLIPCLAYAIIFYGIAISVWRDGSWHYYQLARFFMILGFILGTFCLIGVYVGYDCIRTGCDREQENIGFCYRESEE